MAYEISKEAAESARTAFRRVIESALPAYELGQLNLFHDDDENHIRREVERKLYTARLPNAGDAERKWVTRLKEMSHPDFWKQRSSALAFAEDAGGKSVGWLCARAHAQASALAGLLPREAYDRRGRPNPGQYYFWHPLTFKNDKQGFSWFNELRKAAIEAREWDVKWFAEIMMGGADKPGGTVEGRSDFKIEVLCGLRRWNGEVIRMVRLKNMLGEESEILVLEAECFKAPEHFRAWCLKQGNFSWHGNQNQLQDLHWDTNRMTAWRIMTEVDAMGWHPAKRRRADGTSTWESEHEGLLNGIWFYGDAAYHNGQLLEADRDNIYKVDGEGFFLADRGRESEFELGRPLMQPRVKLGDLLTLRDLEDFSHKPAPKSAAERIQKEAGTKTKTKTETLSAQFDEKELLRAFWNEMGTRFYETAGGHEANLALGAMFSYAAAPELFAAHGLFPGLFIHGQMESGKTKFTEWLFHLAGFSINAGISAIKSSAVGILQASQNYSDLPLWIDEFKQGHVGEDKVGIFRDAYNRLSPVKWNPSGINRKIRTAYVISGESTSSDAAMRSRYPHVQISAPRRLRNNLVWFGQHKNKFFVFWRFVMERRPEFVKLVFKYLALFVNAPGSINEREKMVHGIDWASYRAMTDLIGGEPIENYCRTCVKVSGCQCSVCGGEVPTKSFDDFMVEHMSRAATDVTADTNINIFWTDLIAAFNDDAIPLECFRIESEVLSGGYPAGQHWMSYSLFLEPNLTISTLAAHLRKQGSSVSLRRNDLRDQLSKNDYWIHGNIKKRFGHGLAGGIHAWGFLLDKHPLGRQEVTKQEFEESLDLRQKSIDAAVQFHTFLDGDPRKGPLFAIIHKIEYRARQREAEERGE